MLHAHSHRNLYSIPHVPYPTTLTYTPTNSTSNTPSKMPTGTPCVIVTGSTPRCGFPTTYSYDFGLYNSCKLTISGQGTVSLEVAPDSTGPWTVHNQQTTA